MLFSQAFDLVQGALVSFMHPFYSSLVLYADIVFIPHVLRLVVDGTR